MVLTLIVETSLPMMRRRLAMTFAWSTLGTTCFGWMAATTMAWRVPRLTVDRKGIAAMARQTRSVYRIGVGRPAPGKGGGVADATW